MKQKIRFLVFCSLLISFTPARAAYVPVPISGHTEDVIVNGVGSSFATTTTDVDGVLWCYVAEGWQFSASNTPVTLGLPTGGLINSPLTTGLSYQLADYSQDNSLRLNTSTPGTLTFTTPMSAISLYILCATGSGLSSMAVQVNFSDGTNQVFPAVTVNDWHGGTPYEIGQTTRIQRNTTSTIPENQTSGPRMYSKQFTLAAANQNKLITGVQITRTAGPGILNVFAVSAEIPDVCSGTPNPGTIQVGATEIDCNTSVSLSLDGNTDLNGISYQWQYNISGSWLNFGGNADALFSAPLFTDTWFRCVVTCTEDGSTATTDSVLVTVTDLLVDLGADTTVCPGTNLLLDAGYSGASYIWSNNSFNQTLNVTNPGTYHVIVTLSNGCSGRDTIVVNGGIMPQNVLPPVTNLCEGDMATLNAGNTGSVFLWNTGATTQAIDTDIPGVYDVSITSTDNCVLTTSTELIIRPIPEVALGNDTAVCPGVVLTFDAGTQVTGTSFTWTNGATTQVVQTADSGTHQVIVTSPYNCVAQDDIHVQHFPAPYVEGFSFVPMFYENLGQLYFEALNPIFYTSLEWDFGDGSPVTTEEEPMHIYTAPGDYLVTLNVFNDCGMYSTTQPLHVDLPTGVHTVGTEASGLDLYPNPAQSLINVVLHDADQSIAGFTIYNVLGAVVQEATVSKQQGKAQVNVASLSSGLYTIRLQTTAGWVVRKFEIIR